MTALDWDRTQREKKAEADRDDLPLGAIVLESWIEGSTKKHQARPFSTVLAAVQAAWKGPAGHHLERRGVVDFHAGPLRPLRPEAANPRAWRLRECGELARDEAALFLTVPVPGSSRNSDGLRRLNL
jgi:hypothetical protein